MARLDRSPNQILTVKEVARELRCSKAHVFNAIAGRLRNVTRLPAIRMGRRKLVRRSSLEAWIETNELGSRPLVLRCQANQEWTPCAHERRTFMRRRFQRGSVQKQRNRWVGRWYEGGRRKARVLGPVGKMTKAQAQVALAAILAPINEATDGQDNREITFRDFVEAVFLPCYRRRWKASTAITNIDRMRRHLQPALGRPPLAQLHARSTANLLGREVRRRALVQHGRPPSLGSPPALQAGPGRRLRRPQPCNPPAYSAGGIVGSEAHHESTGGEKAV